MGQIASSVDAENGADYGASIVMGVPNGDEDSRNSNQSESMYAATREKMDSVHCVKTRIDMLIEDCLNVKEASGDEAEEQSSKVSGNKAVNNVVNENQSNKKKEAERSYSGDNVDVKSVQSESGSSNVLIVDKDDEGANANKDVGKSESESNDKSSVKSDTSEKNEVSADSKKAPSPGAGSENSKETKTLKMSDLINDMNTAERVQRHKRAVTTFQTFIDKVLDSSLKQVPDQENIPTNILKLCQESSQPKEEAGTREETRAGGSDSPPTAVKPKFDKSCTKIKPERKITLKDHIERFLELSFREDTSGGSKHSGKPGEDKKEGHGSKNGFDNFNAQGLVNNMITQGLQINRLLSPPILVNHSKNPQRSPDIRVNSSYSHEEGKYQHNTEVKPEVQVPNASYKSDKGMSKGNGYHGMAPRPGHQMHMPPQLSPSQMNSSNHDGHNMSVKDMHENHHHHHHHHQQSDSKMYENSRRDYMYGHQYPPDYSQDQMQHRAHLSMAGQGYMPRMELATSLGVMDQVSRHAMLYPMAASSRASPAGYHPHMPVPHSAAIEEQRSPMARHGRHPLHHKDCVCPICLPHTQQTIDIRDQKKMEYHAQRHSPNVPMYMVSHEIPMHMRNHPLDTTAGMMRPSHLKIPPGAAAATAVPYQTMPKLLPQHPPITTTKEYGPQLMVPGMGYQQGRRPSLPENNAQRPYMHPGNAADYSHGDQSEDYARRPDGMGRGINHSPYPARPSSMPSHENSPHDSYSSMRRSPTISDSGSRSSEASATTEAPLDLSVKTKVEPERPRSSSYNQGAPASSSQKKLNPSNTFLKHLENSVDKYCAELTVPNDPLAAMKQARQQTSRSGTPGDNKQSLPYPAQSPRLASPHSMYNIQQQRKLPSPHFTGGITMGQPLESKSQQNIPRAGEFQYAVSTPQTSSPVSSLPQQNANQGNVTSTPSNFDANKQRNLNSISKHEPIQNIIGSHDPNDILYLICTICTQTYGSPYGFRKHFRNQHGFEPRAEHTIVQTISATKTALHGPVTMATTVSSPYQSHQTSSPSAVKLEAKESTGFVVQNTNSEVDSKSNSGSPLTRRCPSESGSEHSDKSVGKKERFAQEDVSERKYLECPECGKTFQLNDFGSYKRHCRQHSNVKVTGPYTCSDCHLSFPDQKALKEHYIVHVSESHTGNLDASKTPESVPKTSTPSATCFSCARCEKQFDNMSAYNSHMTAHEQPPRLSPNAELRQNKQTAARVASEPSHTVRQSEPSHTVRQPPLSVIPSHNIVKQAAESMTSQACPDSSWDVSVKPVPVEEKASETIVESYDSGYSSSVGSNSMVPLEDKTSENFDKCPAGSVFRQKSIDSNSENNEEQSGEDNFFYKHKKFSGFRKRESVTIHSTDITPPKQVRLSDSSSDRAPPVSSSTTLSVDFKQCDSSQSEDTKCVDQIKPEPTEITNVSSGIDTEYVEKPAKDVHLGKAEARHNLPFVWDRTTRSQRKTK